MHLDGCIVHAPIKMELMGIWWAMKKCHYYLMRCQMVELSNDHKPLESMFNSKDLEEMSQRFMKLRVALSDYNINFNCIAGKQQNFQGTLATP